jgi:outer membrane cobalamin receptor
VLSLLAVLTMTPGPAVAAQDPGAPQLVSVTGVVTDASGGALTMTEVDAVVAGRAAARSVTGADGRYEMRVPALVPFEIRVHRDGFADRVIRESGAAGRVTRDITLQVGGVSDTLLVTPARGAEGRAEATHAVTVVTAADIASTGASSLADVLAYVPGLSVESNGREGALTALFARGGESDYNLVLIDGVRVNENGGRFDFSRIAAGEIDRVEVVRGAQSSLWGSDAIGAVVQVVTKRAGPNAPPQVSGAVEAGSFGTARADVGLSGGARRIEYHLEGGHRRTDGAFEDRLREADRFEQTTVDGSAGAALGSRASLRTGVRYSRALGKSVGQIADGPGNSGGIYDTRDFSWYADVSHVVGSRFTGTARAAYYRFDAVSADRFADPTYDIYAILQGAPDAPYPQGPRLVRFLTAPEFAALSANPASLGAGRFLAFTPFGVSDFPFESRTDFRRPALKYDGSFTWGNGQRLTAGYEFERESTPLDDTVTLDNNAVFVQQQFNVRDRWFVTLGGRVDDKSQYDTFFSPKISAGGYVKPPTTGAVSSVKVFGNLGKGIKTPSFLERFGGGFADPNPALKVERARSADAGIEVTLADQRVRGMATYFDTRFRDQVEFSFSGSSGDGIADYINIAGAAARGLELEAALMRPVHGITVTGGYTYLHTEVLETTQTGGQFRPGQPLIRRPAHSAAVRARYQAGPFTASGDVRVVSDRHDAFFFFDGFQTVPGAALPASTFTDITINPGYAVAGLGLDYRLDPSITVYVRGNNVTNTNYDNALGYPGLPRAVLVGARVNVGRRRR